MATYSSWDLKGVLDNCQDFVDQIVPEDTPFYNAMAKIPARTNSFSWITDWNDGDVLGHTLGTNVDTGRIEDRNADDIPANSSENTPLNKQETASNYVQIFRKLVKVSKSAAATGTHGRKSETQYQIEKAITDIKNQIEGTFVSGQTARKATGNTEALAAKTAGATAQIPQTMFSADDSAAGVKALTDKLFQNGSLADTIYCNRKAYAALIALMKAGVDVGPYLQWQNLETGKDWMTFTDSNGRLYKMIAHRHLDEISETNLVAIFLNTDDFQCVEFRPITITQLDTRGSYDQYLVECEVGLRHSGKYKAAVLAKA